MIFFYIIKLMEHLQETILDKIERQYQIIIPKYDNSFHKLKPEKLQEYIWELADHFGGATIIPCAGAWVTSSQC